MNFEEAGRQYSTLKAQYDKRLISFAEFEEKAQNLVATAPDGRKFFIDPRTGTWVEVGAKSSSSPTGGPSSKGKEASPPETLLQFLSLTGKSIVKSIPKLIVISLGISLLTWAYHTYLVAVVNDGLMYNPSRQALNSVIHIQESYFPGINAFWGLLAYFLKSFVMRIFQMGPQGWVEHNRNFGTHIRQSYFKLGKRAPEAILMGAAIALIFAFLYRNFMLSWVLALGFVIIALAHFKGLEIMVVKIGFSDLERLLKRRLLREGEELDTIFLAFLGMAGGFLLAGLMGTRFWAGLVFGLLFLLAFVLYRKRELQGATLLILLALGGALLLPESQVLAWCEGGSFTQGGGNWVDWWGSDNADVVRQNGIGPALSAAMGAMLGGMSAAGAAGASIVAPGGSEVQTASEGSYIFDDGREYYEGRNYTFQDGDNCIEYKVVNGDLVPIRELRNGEAYIDYYGDRKIWIGGQSWYEEDWRRQAATNQRYRAAHDADWAVESTRLNPDMVATQQQYELEKEAIHHLGRMQHVAVRHGMAVEGAVDDMYGRAGKILEQIRSGEKPDFEKISRLRSYIGNRVSGFTPGPGDYPPPEKSWWADSDAWSEGLVESGRNLSRAQNSDGSISWRGLGSRIALGALTGGASEWVFVPMASTFTMKDAVDSGASGLGAAWQGIRTAVAQDLIGRGIGIGLRGAKGAWQGGTTGAWQGVRTAAVDQARQAGDVFSRKAWQATGQKLTNSISNGSQRFANVVTGQEGYTGPRLQEMKDGAQRGLDRILGRKPKLSTVEEARLKLFNQAVNSGDPERVARLYGKGGMKHLSELQKKGYISPDAARKCNSLLKANVDNSVREGTRNTIIDFQKKTHVRVKEVIVADSGSSAKGQQITRLNTDFDRTLIPEFHKKDLRWYAKQKGITEAQAYNELCDMFKNTHQDQVGRSIGKKLGITSDDVGYASYDRIGAASGQSDSYPNSFTNARQAVSGTAEKYSAASGGKVTDWGKVKPTKISGQSAVDANQLNMRNYGTGSLEADPTRLLPQDTKPVLQQQLDSIFGKGKTGNPEALAKSVERFHKQASVGQYSAADHQLADASRNTLNQANDRLIKTSKLLRDVGTDPGKIDQIVRQNGYSSINDFNQECVNWLRYAGDQYGIPVV